MVKNRELAMVTGSVERLITTTVNHDNVTLKFVVFNYKSSTHDNVGITPRVMEAQRPRGTKHGKHVPASCIWVLIKHGYTD